MNKKKTMGLCALAAALVLVLILVVVLGRKGNLSHVAEPAPPEAKKAVDVFSQYVHMDRGSDGSYLQITMTAQDGKYVMLEKYRDVGGQFFYKFYTLSEYDTERFEENIRNFQIAKKEPDESGAYVKGTVTFSTKSGYSNYVVEPFDMTGYGVETNPDVSQMVSNISDDMNRLMPVSELAERLVFTTNAELGGYLKLVYDQIVYDLYDGDPELLAEAWHTVYGVSLLSKESPKGTYLLEVSCDKGVYEVGVTESGYVYELTQTASAEEADLENQVIIKEVN